MLQRRGPAGHSRGSGYSSGGGAGSWRALGRGLQGAQSLDRPDGVLPVDRLHGETARPRRRCAAAGSPTRTCGRTPPRGPPSTAARGARRRCGPGRRRRRRPPGTGRANRIAGPQQQGRARRRRPGRRSGSRRRRSSSRTSARARRRQPDADDDRGDQGAEQPHAARHGRHGARGPGTLHGRSTPAHGRADRRGWQSAGPWRSPEPPSTTRGGPRSLPPVEQLRPGPVVDPRPDAAQPAALRQRLRLRPRRRRARPARHRLGERRGLDGADRRAGLDRRRGSPTSAASWSRTCTSTTSGLADRVRAGVRRLGRHAPGRRHPVVGLTRHRDAVAAVDRGRGRVPRWSGRRSRRRGRVRRRGRPRTSSRSPAWPSPTGCSRTATSPTSPAGGCAPSTLPATRPATCASPRRHPAVLLRRPRAAADQPQHLHQRHDGDARPARRLPRLAGRGVRDLDPAEVLPGPRVALPRAGRPRRTQLPRTTSTG